MAETKEGLKRIFAGRRRVRELHSQVETAKLALAEVKASLKVAVGELMELIDEEEHPTPTLFNQPAAESGDDPAWLAEIWPTAPAVESEPEGWRDVTLASLGIDGKLLELLQEAEVATLGAIADFCQHRRLTDIKGVGQAKADQIQEAMDRYWAQHRPAASVTPGEPAADAWWHTLSIDVLDIKPEVAGMLAGGQVSTLGELVREARKRDLCTVGLAVEDVQETRQAFAFWYAEHVIAAEKPAPQAESDEQGE